MLVLGIETSCDETAVALVENGKRILSNVVSSSLHLHKKYGGVVPEIATRYHVELINCVLAEALNKAKAKPKDIDLIAAVYGPGLVGALLIGLSLAKALSLSLNKPLVGVNHLQAHLYAAMMEKKRIRFPFVGFVVSGGHTNLFYVRDYLRWQMIGKTRDDAAGESFDKVAKILKLGYPGGPIIERRALQGNSTKIRFPRSYLEEDSLDFSFSGVKTAVLYYVRDHGIRNIAASFQEAVIDILTEKAAKACRLKKVKDFVAGGGVLANQRLRKSLSESLAEQGIRVHFPKLKLCQDNAVMVAGLSYQLYRRGVVSNLNLEVAPNLKV
ncbi:MAG: tRNA (adenosine(37)-N6)-threonylcarbamoyltransferase complex transferase subunit TsaD [Omnitrophica bacterium]|nr:tRNA (adenosine(37)-N6)-threonylcarbamoyltransferase complex transferase subunit TsaD [Candidatus Omnitrophota bacterium]